AETAPAEAGANDATASATDTGPGPAASATAAPPPVPPNQPPMFGLPPPPVAPIVPARPEGVHPLFGAAREYRRYVASPAASLYGARVLTEWPLPLPHLVLRADVASALGSSGSTLGTISLETLAGAAGAEWITAGDDLAFAFGALAEAGYAHAGGRAKA